MEVPAQQPVSLSQPFTAEDVLKFTAAALSGLFTQAAAKPALLAACRAVHLDVTEGVVDEFLKAAVATQQQASGMVTPSKRAKKPAGPKKLSSYSLYAVKMAQQLRETDAQSGKPPASNYMLQATSAYKTFSVEWKKRFAEVYAPLLQKLNEDAVKNFGNHAIGTPKLLDEVHKFEAEHKYPGFIDMDNAEALVTKPSKEKKARLSAAPDAAAEEANGSAEDQKVKKKKKKRTAENGEGSPVKQEAVTPAKTIVGDEDGQTEEKKKKKKKKKHEESD